MPINYQPITGVVTMISDFGAGYGREAGCNKLFSIESSDRGPVNFVVTPTTYFINHTMVAVGDTVTGFYNANAPAPAIYPPQLEALVMAKTTPYQSVKVDFFDSQLVSSDGTLKLSISPSTRIVLENGQLFTGDPTNRYLIVIYSITTRSIPAQTNPDEVVVICSYCQVNAP
ncbi:MAG TPA: hypothetical protein VHR47_01030 [Bacillota bacterium]|nr:hypothetical protein [Bacillota bacterium]